MFLARASGQDRPGLVPIEVQQTSFGLRATGGNDTLEVTVCGDAVIHVTAKPAAAAAPAKQPWMLDARVLHWRSLHVHAELQSCNLEDREA